MEFSAEKTDLYESVILNGPEVALPDGFESKEQMADFINYCLAETEFYAGNGMTRWWNRPIRSLEGFTPLEALDLDPQGLISYVVHMLDGHGS